MRKEKRLIINADDFGLHSSINKAVINGYNSGCVTSTSLMTGGNAWEEAVNLARDNPGLGVGVHLTLVGARPVTEPGLIPSLVGADGFFPAAYPQFVKRLLQGKINLSEARRELSAQLDRAMAAGIAVTHVDSHQHLHVLPSLIDIVLDLAAKRSIRAIRIPDEALLFTGNYPYTIGRLIGRTGLSITAGLARQKARRRGFAVPDHFFGMLAGGNMREEYLLNIVNSLQPGVSEIMVHPGCDDSLLERAFNWSYHWNAEFSAVTSGRVLEQINKQAVDMISFREIANE